MNRILLVGALALAALAPTLQAQKTQPRTVVRPRPQKPLEVPPAVVVLQVDTTRGDSTRTIIQRDFDYGDRIQPLILDSVSLADIWQPGDKRINFAPLAQTRANFANQLLRDFHLKLRQLQPRKKIICRFDRERAHVHDRQAGDA